MYGERIGSSAILNLVCAGFCRRALASDLLSTGLVFDQRHERGREGLEQLHRKRAGELVLGRVGLMDVGGDGSEIPLADKEHKRRGAVHYAGGNQASASPKDFVAMVAGSGLAP